MMAVRPAVAAIRRIYCRSYVLCPSTSVLGGILNRPIAVRQAMNDVCLPRLLTTGLKDNDSAPQQPPNHFIGSDIAKPLEPEPPVQSNNGLDTPWYLQVEPPRHAPKDDVPALPNPPHGAPTMLEPIVKHLYEEMGLDDLAILDLRAIDPPPALGPNLLMVLGTARSKRHLHASTGMFVHWIKKHHGILASADGLILPSEQKIKLRRLRRKATRMGGNAMALPGWEDAIATEWICVNLGTVGKNAGEAATFDDGGRLSGFGTEALGTTIVVQVMTEKRRQEVDLESMWTTSLKKSTDNDKILQESAAKQLASPSPRERNAPTKNISRKQLRRLGRLETSTVPSYSTTRLASTMASPVMESELCIPPARYSLAVVRGMIEDIKWAGRKATYEECNELLNSIFQADSASGETAKDQQHLVTALLETMYERGLLTQLAMRDILVLVVTSVARKGFQSPELRRIQENMELLLLKGNVGSLKSSQIADLMQSYAEAGDWDRFWNTWRIPTRFLKRRDEDMYCLVFRLVAETKSQSLCIDALRQTVQEMLHEEPPVRLTGQLFEYLKMCIRTADPKAEEVLKHLASGMTLTSPVPLEFVDLLRDLQEIDRKSRLEHHLPTASESVYKVREKVEGAAEESQLAVDEDFESTGLAQHNAGRAAESQGSAISVEARSRGLIRTARKRSKVFAIYRRLRDQRELRRQRTLASSET
jgi:hypothetical protein